MSKKLKLSQWHDGSVKPVHVGVYERDWREEDKFYCMNPYYAFWDGKRWCESRISVKDAISDESITFASVNQKSLKWRGIVK